MKKILSIAILNAIFLFSFAGCVQPTSENQIKPEDNKIEEQKPADEVKPEETAKPDETTDKVTYKTLEEASAAAILAVSKMDTVALAAMSGEKGVRFSPYAYINVETDVVLDPLMLENALALSRTFVWGSYDGSGEPIDLPFGQYYEKFVYDKEFIKAPQIKYNEFIGQGNTINNFGVVYPNAEFVEYHFPGFDKQYEGMDWESLRLVFEEKDGNYYLIGIIHDGWTI